MGKKLILIILLLLLTGCKVEYKININDVMELGENITITATTDADKEKINAFDSNIPVDKNENESIDTNTKLDDIDYYDIKKEDNKLIIKYNYNSREYDTYINSKLVNMAFEYISVNKVEGNLLVLSSSKEFLLFKEYLDLEEVRVTITTNYKVLSHSADEKNSHDYTWIFNKDNAYGKGIYLKVDMSEEDITFIEKLIRGDYLNAFILSNTILIIGYILYRIIKKREAKVNAI